MPVAHIVNPAPPDGATATYWRYVMIHFTITSIRTSEDGLNLIKRYEGCEPRMYYCPAGKATIGYGHLCIGKEKEYFKDKTMTEMEMTNLLKRDVGFAEAAIRRYVKVSLTQGQYDALVSFIFNLGAGAFRSSTLLRVLNRGSYGECPRQINRWTRASGRVLLGLVRRRAAEVQSWKSRKEIENATFKF